MYKEKKHSYQLLQSQAGPIPDQYRAVEHQHLVTVEKAFFVCTKMLCNKKPMHTTNVYKQHTHLLWIVWVCLGAVWRHQSLLVWTQTASLTLALLGNFLIQTQAASIQKVVIVQCTCMCLHVSDTGLYYVQLHTSTYLAMFSSAPTPEVTSSINSQWKLISSTHSYDFLSIEMIHLCWLLLYCEHINCITENDDRF